MKYPNITVKLTGTDGKALRKVGAPKEEVVQFNQEAMSGDYNNLLNTAMNWVNVQ